MTNLSKELEGVWGGQYGASAQQTRLKPQLFFGRYLVLASVASRNIGIYDVKSRQKVAMIEGMPQADLLEDVLLSVDQRHAIQLNSDGQFFLHEIATGRMALSGRYVDGEIILYTPEAYYSSSYEGAHFVQLRFPGLPELYSFQQFAAVLNRPDRDQSQARGREPRDAATARAAAGGRSPPDRGFGCRWGSARGGAGAFRRRAGPPAALSGRAADRRQVHVRASNLPASSRLPRRATRAGSRHSPPTRAGSSRPRRCSRSSRGRARQAGSSACWSASTPMARSASS